MKPTFHTSLCYVIFLCFSNFSLGQTFTKSGATASNTYDLKMEFVAESYDNTLYKLTTTITNTGSADIEMNKGVFRYTSDINHFAFINYINGNLSYPDNQALSVSVVDDDGSFIHSVAHVFPTESWAKSKLKNGDSFAVIAHVKASQTTLSSIASSMEFHVDGSVPPLFYGVTINAVGNDNHSAKLFYKKQGSSSVNNKSFNSSTTVDMRIGKTYMVWSEDFVEGSFRYKSMSTETAPKAIVSAQNAILNLNFNKESVETKPYSFNVSGLPQGTSTSLTAKSHAESVEYNINISNGQNVIQQMVVSDYELKVDEVTDLTAKKVYSPTYTQNISVSASGVNSTSITFISKSVFPFSVKGYPKHLSHGTVTSGSPAIDDSFKGTEIDVIFKYSGNDGAGDRGEIAPTFATKNTIEQSRRLEQEMNRKVMPLMIHYTANASGGGSKEAIKDLEGDNLYYHYRSLIEEIKVMLGYKDDQHPYPASLIISPDLLGAIQQDVINGHDEGILTKHFDVNAKIKLAFDDANIDTTLLPTFENNFKGYLQSVNYIITTVGECSIPFGYQQNVWSAGSALWVFDDANEASDAQNIGSRVATFINDLGVYEGDWKPDFIAFDRYERDCFGPDGRSFYAWTPKHWDKYLDYCEVVAEGIGNPPVMLWQIPGGHIPTTTENLMNFDPNRFSSAAPQYLLGDSKLNSGASNAINTVKDISVSGAHYGSSSTVGQLLTNDPHDWNTNQLKRLADMNVFNICWGGGSTLGTVPIGTNGNDDGWLANKIITYNNNVYFNSNQDFGYSISVACDHALSFSEKTPAAFAYPNPTTGELIFSVDTFINKIKLYDISGRLLKEFQSSRIDRISLKELADGVYFVKVNTDGNREATIRVKKGN